MWYVFWMCGVLSSFLLPSRESVQGVRQGAVQQVATSASNTEKPLEHKFHLPVHHQFIGFGPGFWF